MINPQTDRDRPNSDERDEPSTGRYFVAAYPPFSAWSTEQVNEAIRRLNDPAVHSTDTPLGLYIHIPFCEKRCDYCYYRSSANPSAAQLDDYVTVLSREFSIHTRLPAFMGRAPSFVYFGGGTPSLLGERSLARLLHELSSRSGWANAEEVSFECAPHSVTDAKLRLLREHGVTRISLGVQAMDDGVLKENGRIHQVDSIMRAYASIRQTGFPVTNVDLIVGLMGETDASFLEGVDRIITMEPESVTIYLLEIPTNTPLYRRLHTEDGSATGIATWETKRKRLGETFVRLEANGYHVRSAYAAVRDPVRHRFVYQDAQYHGADLLGIGASSFSYVGGTHFQNETAATAYSAKVRAGVPPIRRAYVLSHEEQAIREFVLQLKLGSIDPAYFRQKYDVDVIEMFRDPLDELRKAGWLSIAPDCIKLSREGLLRADRLLERFYGARHRTACYHSHRIPNQRRSGAGTSLTQL